MSSRSASSLAAYVLHRYDWSESSLVLDLYTRDQGRLAVAAKGAKRPYSQLRSVLLPFQRLQVALGKAPPPGPGDDAPVQTLRTAEWSGGAAMLRGHALFAGYYLNELLMKLLARADPHPVLFDAYDATLPALAAGDDTLTEAALRAFEIVLLREIGLLPELDLVTATQQPLGAEGRYALLPDAGLAPAAASSDALTGAQWLALQQALHGGELPALQSACAVALVPLKPALRAVLAYHLGSMQLRTRRVMQGVQQLLEPSSRGPFQARAGSTT